ncbi:MAG TPA: hypothetical protein VMU51_04695 [Mycobacteriales bacterium]|nr:hypothetical protein [Mycobacteriales bacterium]
MKIPRRTALLVAGWSAAGVLAVGAVTGVGIAFAGGTPLAAAAPSATPTASASPETPGQGGGKADRPNRPDRPRLGGGRAGGLGHGLGLGGTALHGEFTVKDKDGKIVTRVVQHGQVTAVSSTSITLKSEDGFTGTYAVNGDTKVRVGGSSAAITGVKTGNEGWVVATRSGSTSTATNLVVRT